MSRLETMRRFELPGIEYDREPPECGQCSECFAEVPREQLEDGMCPKCREQAWIFFVAFLRCLSKNELEYINNMCDGVDLHDIAEREKE